ncbi:conserved protein of unknown function [Pseudomonas marincola]|uniref:Uncharacterized protein n=1 Tax=Pseudomonas marincola TaxID=437900 RepID=A0A653E3K0_9PSED|nr:conserved protein of unknown function [Pseudomonas marincola]
MSDALRQALVDIHGVTIRSPQLIYEKRALDRLLTGRRDWRINQAK